MKKAVILLISIFSFTTLFANSAEEQEFRTRLKEFSEQNKTITCDFAQEKEVKNIKHSIKSEGLFYYNNLGNMALIYETPKGDKIVMNGDQFTIVAAGKSVVDEDGSNPMLTQIAAMMRGCMGGDISQFTNGWIMTFEAQQDQYKVTLTPESRRIKRFIESIVMCFDRSDLTLDRLEINEMSGGGTSYTFTNKRLNQSIDPKVFTHE